MTKPSENEPEQSDIMQLFQVINNPAHDNDHVTILDLAEGRFKSTEPKDDKSDK
jgi:hypothetical protein